ncbi:hypothetical protein HZC31_05880 [Candidatus Woesearchaeota archaeon]|nr:hypothetical protein [Candidatus Woesearchaeota archaeon]
MKRIISLFLWVLVFCLSVGIVFGQEEREECEGLLELEMRHTQLEQYVIENELEVPAPELREITEVEEGKMPSCDEQIDVVTNRIEQLEVYIEENDLDLPEEPSDEEAAALKAKMEENAPNKKKGSEMFAEKSEGMPSCEADIAMLKQRIVDLEKYIEENELELPEPSKEEQARAEVLKEADESAKAADEEREGTIKEEKQQEPREFFKGMFKKFTGFFGGNKDAEKQPFIEPPMMEQPIMEEPKEGTEE